MHLAKPVLESRQEGFVDESIFFVEYNKLSFQFNSVNLYFLSSDLPAIFDPTRILNMSFIQITRFGSCKGCSVE